MPGHEVYGFVPYWEMDAGIAEHLAETDLSTLALFSVTHRSSGRMQDNQTGYKRITGDLGQRLIRQAHERGTRVELVYTSFGEAKNRAFYGSDKAQSRWIKELVDFTEEQGFDGINVDVELLPADLVPAYGAWVGRLRTALRERLPDAQVSVSTTGGHTRRRDGRRCERCRGGSHLPHGLRLPLAGLASRVPRRRWTGSMARIATSCGRWTATPRSGSRSRRRSSACRCTATRGRCRDRGSVRRRWAAVTPGFRAGTLRVFEDESFDPEYNTTESVEFYAVPDEDDGSWDAVYYDSPRSLTPKLALANDRGLAGAGFWAIGYERGLPDYTKLIKSFAAGELPEAEPAE